MDDGTLECNKTSWPWILFYLLYAALAVQRKYGNLTSEKVCKILTNLELCNEDTDSNEIDVLCTELDCVYLN
jgi:hypothetical protein